MFVFVYVSYSFVEAALVSCRVYVFIVAAECFMC